MNVQSHAVMRPTRVLCLSEKWESGGIEAFLTGLYEAMDLTNMAIDIMTCQYTPGIYDERLQACGLKVRVLSGSIKRWRANLALFTDLLHATSYDVVHLNLYEGMALLFARAAKQAGVPRVIVHSHNTDLHPGLLRVPKLAIHRACVETLGCYADLRWAPSQAAAAFLFGGRPWTLIRNGIDLKRFAFDPVVRAAMRAQLGADENTRVIGCVGRLCAQKNQTFLLRVLAQMPANTMLVLAGEGEDEKTLQDQAVSLGIAGRVRLCGTLPDVAPLYSALDVLAMPSLFEGLGIVAVEAQAVGLPVVVSPAVPPEARVEEGLCKTVPLDEEIWRGALVPMARVLRGTAPATDWKAYDRDYVAFGVREAYLSGRGPMDEDVIRGQRCR